MERVRRRVAVELGERFFDVWFEAEKREAVSRAKRSDPAMSAAVKPIASDVGDRIAGFEGAKPNEDQLAKAGAEIVRLNDLDPGLRGRAVRMGVDWPLETLFKRGRISKRQMDAARLVRDLFEEGGFARIKGASLNERVDTSHVFAKCPDGGSQARGRYLEAMRVFGPLQRALMEAVIVKGSGVTEAADARCNGTNELPNEEKRRTACAMALVKAGLDTLVIHFRL